MEGKDKCFISASNQEGKKPAYQISKQIRAEWENLWNQRIEDKLTAEDVARRNYDLLFIEKGTIIKATRDYKPPNLEEILERNEFLLDMRLTCPHPEVGGWRKFSKETLSKQPRWHVGKRRSEEPFREKSTNGPPKKGGRGWLHRH